MLGKTHLAVGVAATIFITQPASVSELILAAGFGGGGALISDIDVETSGSHRKAELFTKSFVVIAAGILAADYFLHTGIVKWIVGTGGYKFIAGMLLFAGICAFGKEQPHRSFMHSFLAGLLLCIAIGLIWEDVVIYFAVGFLSHLLLDMCNKKKIRLFYPLKGGIALGLAKADGLANRVLLRIASVSVIVEFILFIAGMFGLINPHDFS